MHTVLVTGGTGLVGSALSAFLLAQGSRVIVFTRSGGQPATPGMSYAHWDPDRGMLDEQALLEADSIVHLAGEPVMQGRWSRGKKAAIYASRVKSMQLLTTALDHLPHHVTTLVSASATAYYGDCGARTVQETDPAGKDFLAGICARWEEAARAAPEGIRVVVVRTPPVLAPEAPQLAPLTRLLRLGIAPVPGPAEVWCSWIHIGDLVRIYAAALRNPSLTGAYNAVSPFPVTIAQLSASLARKLKGRFVITAYIPPPLIRWLAGERGSASLVSVRASAGRLLSTGFEFSFPTLGGALDDLYPGK